MSAAAEDGFEQAAQTTAAEARTLAWKLSFLLRGLHDADAEFAAQLRDEVIAILTPDGRPRQQAAAGATPYIVSSAAAAPDMPREKLPEIEWSIMDMIKEDDGRMSLSAIHERLQDLNDYNITKASLSVRLHRMVKNGRLASPSRGIYEIAGGSRPRPGEAVSDLRTRR